MNKRKVLLCILDGLGYREDTFGNAVLKAKFLMDLIKSDKCTLLEASGKAVGLPLGQFGNSEVGHMTIGSGRIFKQKLPLISDSIESGELGANQTLLNFIKGIKNNRIHLMGLFSKGGVHSDIEHYFWAIEFLRNLGVNIACHLFLDGRDVGYRNALPTLSNAISTGKIALSEIATIQGRFYAMDRDKRIERTEIALSAIINAQSSTITNNPINAINTFYEKDINDETMPPIVMDSYKGAEIGESFWMLNFRVDRIKQILKALQQQGYSLLNMVSCDEDIDAGSDILFQNTPITNSLGELFAKHGVKNLRVAETEKYAHVTYFFNAGDDVQYDFEDRLLVQSPKANSYDETPAMSSGEITEKIKEAIKSSEHSVIIVNYANPDMLGHTGNFDAACESMEILDEKISELISAARSANYDVIITSDHGNAEEMINQDKTPHKTHTNAKVPFIILSDQMKINTRKTTLNTLADVAPTILDILGMGKPNEMTGESLVTKR